MQKQLPGIQKVHHRPGEGHTVDMTIMSTTGRYITAQMDLTMLPVPERRFSCDAVGVQFEAPTVRLLFAQRQPVGADLLSMLAINMVPESVAQFLSSVPASFASEFVKLSEKLPSARVTDFTTNAAQSIVLSSTMVMAGYNGLNGCMDFYFASPFAVQQVATIRKMSLESIVRVNLSTGLMLALIDALGKGAEKFDWLKSGE